MKIGIVNDVAMALEILRRVVSSVPEYNVVWLARDGQEAVRKCAEQVPDLVLMDLLMPVMDGVEATRQIMAKSPCAILVVTATVSGNAAKVFEAMGHGALDAVNTPCLEDGLDSPGAQALLAKIHSIGRLVRKPHGPQIRSYPARLPLERPASFPPLVAMGASTGGPAAIAAILGQLPPDLPAAVAIVQHINQEFVDGLAAWLNQRSSLPVQVAPQNCYPDPAAVYLANGKDHLVLTDHLTFGYTREPAKLVHRPSVDVFFSSLARLPRGSVLGILLTGMGRDGAQGLLALHRAGHHTIAQDAASSVVFGMPRAAAELNAATEIMPVNQISASVARHFSRRNFRTETRSA